MTTENSIMSGDNGNLEIILVRMEGKIDRMSDRMDRYERDQSAIRQRLHDLAGEITPVIMLNIPERIRTADTFNAKIDARVQQLEDTEMQRKGAQATIRVLWAILGVVGVGGVASLLRLLQVGGFQ